MNEAINEYKSKDGKKILRVYNDESPESPRSWNCFGKMVCFHNRYNLGDKHNFDDAEEVQEFIKDKNVIWLPLYLYDHSGITMNTTGFTCRWDSGQVGIIYVTKKDILKEFRGYKKVTKKLIEKAKQIMINEVETYDQYLSGDVYGFTTFEVIEAIGNNGKTYEEEEEKDSCWGFYGSDIQTNGILDNAGLTIEEFKNEYVEV